jgi:flagellar basal-body rod protein FlgB
MAHALLNLGSKRLGNTMIDALFNQPNYVAAKRMLDATALRFEAVASNLANVETPGYRRIHVPTSFANELQQAIASGNPQEIAALRPRLEEDRDAVARRPDGNTVDLEGEMLQLYRTSVEHAAQTQFVTGNLLKLRYAITGRQG